MEWPQNQPNATGVLLEITEASLDFFLFHDCTTAVTTTNAIYFGERPVRTSSGGADRQCLARSLLSLHLGMQFARVAFDAGS